MLSEQTEQVVDYYHGIPVADPFRWLEDGSSPAVRAWTEQQNVACRAYMDSLPDRTNIRSNVGQMLSIDQIESPWQVGPRLFYLKRAAQQQQPCLILSEHGAELLLADPNTDERSALTFHILQVSADGKRVALGEKIGGEDTCAVRFLDVDSREFLPAKLSRGHHRGIAFGVNANYIYHAHERLRSPKPHYRAVFRVDLLTGQESEVFFAGEGPHIRARVIPGCDGDWMAYLVREPGKHTNLYLHSPLRGNPPLLINGPQTPECGFLRIGTKCYALVRRDGGERQVVKFDAATPEVERWEVILSKVPESLTDCTIWQDFICLTGPLDQGSATTVYDLDGNLRDLIQYPEGGTLRIHPRRGPGQTGIYYQFSSFDCPPTVKRYDITAKRHRTVFTEAIPFASNRIEKIETTYRSTDGTEVPICIAWDPDHVLPAPAPLILTAYGGFGTRVTPTYSAFITFMLQQGFRHAFANVRGGSELGDAWHAGGKRKNKPQTIDDFIAAAEWLCDSGWTTPQQQGSVGACHSALVIVAAMMKRPDLFGAVLCLNPLLDMLRYHKFDLAYRWITEFGSADDPEDFPVLLSYSPYHGVQEDAVYPPILFISGEADNRTDPFHARKTAARMQAEAAQRNPVLVDISETRGHSPTMPLGTRIEALTDRIAFLCNELGVRVPRLAATDRREASSFVEVVGL
jgi:prolyl oligopeptidase